MSETPRVSHINRVCEIPRRFAIGFTAASNDSATHQNFTNIVNLCILYIGDTQ
jgi:hypothetical protein